MFEINDKISKRERHREKNDESSSPFVYSGQGRGQKTNNSLLHFNSFDQYSWELHRCIANCRLQQETEVYGNTTVEKLEVGMTL